MLKVTRFPHYLPTVEITYWYKSSISGYQYVTVHQMLQSIFINFRPLFHSLLQATLNRIINNNREIMHRMHLFRIGITNRRYNTFNHFIFASPL